MTLRQIGIRATYMRGGTSKGVFFAREDLPQTVLQPGHARDAFFLRVIGSPDPYGKQIDGMGAATSSTSKVVIVGKSERQDCDVDFLFGQVDIAAPVVDWSGSCGNLVSAVGPFAIERGMVQVPRDGIVEVRIWQANLGKRIVAHVPMRNGEVVEEGDFELDGVAFPAPSIQVDFLDLTDDALLPTARQIDILEVDGRCYEVTLITAGNPTIFIDAAALGLSGTELPDEINGKSELMAHLERIRAHGAVRMGLAASASEATRQRPHTPKVCMLCPSRTYRATSGKTVHAEDIDVGARIISMGKLHHALTGTGAVALATAAAIPSTVVHRLLGPTADIRQLRVGHCSGRLVIGAFVERIADNWHVQRVTVHRSARRLMDGQVFVPAHIGSQG